jgi:hypothetical protein
MPTRKPNSKRKRTLTRILSIVAIVAIVLAMPVAEANAALQVFRKANVYVRDKTTNATLADALVSLDGVPQGSTNSKGAFTINRPYTGTHQLTISKTGYVNYTSTIDIKPNNNTSTIYLAPAAAQNADYVIFADPADGGRVKARNSVTNNIDYVGDDPAAVLQSAINALASTGGDISLAAGTYVWRSVPAFPRNLPNWLKIVGQGDVTIQLTNQGPRAFDFNKVADYDTFQNIWIENLVIDCNNVGGRNHVVLGTYRDGNEFQQRINIQDITIKHITTKNVPVDPTLVNHRLNIYLVVKHPNAGEKQTVIRNIWIEDCDLQGGNHGITVGNGGLSRVGINVFIDNIHILRCRHSLLSVQTSAFDSVNFLVGGRGFGGYAEIVDCYGEYSGDVGVEINAMNALIERTTIKDAALRAFYHTNFNYPPSDQHITFKDCVALRADLPAFVTTQTSSGFDGQNAMSKGFSAWSQLSIPLGTLVFEHCQFRSTSPVVLNEDALSIHASDGISAVTVSDFTAAMEGVQYSLGSSTNFNSIVIDVQGSTPSISLKNISLVVDGVRQTNAGTPYFTGIDLEGNMALQVENVVMSYKMLNGRDFSVIGMDVGGGGTTITAGTISGFSVQQVIGDSASYGIVLRAATTITSLLNITQCNFTGLPSGQAVWFESGSQSNKVVLSGNIGL